ncbi:MAG: AmmeMemoRadiSam system protein B [archaeon]
MRKPVYAGSFYPKSSHQLSKMIEDCFNSKLGPGALPSVLKKGSPSKPPLKAIISPHAGYVYSGMAAAWGYLAISQCSLPDVFILLGPNHNSGRSGVSVDTFETPLGLMRVDHEFMKLLVKKGTISIDEEIHAEEHSLEVQLPFLQFALGNRADQAKIVPILISHDVDPAKLADDLKAAIKESKKSVTFIVSSDFTHQGPSYGFIPFKKDIKENISKMDGELIKFIRKGDFEDFEVSLHETHATVCGALPISVLLRTISFDKALLEQYYTSGDVVGDYTNSVSYASIVFR